MGGLLNEDVEPVVSFRNWNQPGVNLRKLEPTCSKHLKLKSWSQPGVRSIMPPGCATKAHNRGNPKRRYIANKLFLLQTSLFLVQRSYE